MQLKEHHWGGALALICGFVAGGMGMYGLAYPSGIAEGVATVREEAMVEVRQCEIARGIGLPENCTRVERLAGLKPMSELCQSFAEIDKKYREAGQPGLDDILKGCKDRKY